MDGGLGPLKRPRPGSPAALNPGPRPGVFLCPASLGKRAAFCEIESLAFGVLLAFWETEMERWSQFDQKVLCFCDEGLMDLPRESRPWGYGFHLP